MGQALMSGRMGGALLFSVVIHACLIWANAYHSKEQGLPNLLVKTTGFDAHIRAMPGSANSTDRVVPKAEFLYGSNSTSVAHQANFVAAELPRKPSVEPQLQVGESGAEESTEPIQGMMVGALGFTGFGGTKKRPFELVGAAELRIQNANAESHGAAPVRRIAQEVLTEMKSQLNQLMPADPGQVCQVQVSVTCQKRNDRLEKYLLSKAPMLQQLVGGRTVSVVSEEGLWKIHYSTRAD